MLEVIIKGGILIALLFGAAAYMTLAERVVMARMQLRLGPNRVGPLGLLQPIADGIKLLAKERFQPHGIEIFTYWLAPAISVFVALFVFVLIPMGDKVSIFGYEFFLRLADIDAGLLFILACSSLAVYGIVLAGWSSNNRYSLLGGLRSTAQMISYEVPMAISVLTIAMVASTLSLPKIVEAQSAHWFIWTNPIAFIVYLITSFAETNRSPFDFPESEQELVGGYHTEYGGMKFAMFFLAEYVNILAVSALSVTLFFGGWHAPVTGWECPLVWFLLKLGIFVFFFIWVRATMARLRYEQMMSFGWKILVPVATINFIVTAYFWLV